MRELLHRSEQQMQAAAGVRVLSVMRWWLVPVLSLSVALPAASEDFGHGNGFHRYCSDFAPTTKSAEWGRLVCVSYLRGLLDMATYLQPASKASLVCWPEAVTYDQFLDVLLKYLKDNPARRHDLTAELIWEAAAKSYPCPRR